MNFNDDRRDCALAQGTHLPNSSSAPEEPIQLKGFSITYDRRFATGSFEYLHPAITLRLNRTSGEDEPFDLHHAKERVRRMARENIRAQLLRLQGKKEVIFLGLQPPFAGRTDPIVVQSACLSLIHSVNLGDGNWFTPGYSDWADLRSVAHHPGELHMALARLWQSLWVNLEDEVSRARGEGETNGFFGLPPTAKVASLSECVSSSSAYRSSQAAFPSERPANYFRGGDKWTP